MRVNSLIFIFLFFQHNLAAPSDNKNKPWPRDREINLRKIEDAYYEKEKQKNLRELNSYKKDIIEYKNLKSKINRLYDPGSYKLFSDKLKKSIIGLNISKEDIKQLEKYRQKILKSRKERKAFYEDMQEIPYNLRKVTIKEMEEKNNKAKDLIILKNKESLFKEKDSNNNNLFSEELF